jgi:hypothetical protein
MLVEVWGDGDEELKNLHFGRVLAAFPSSSSPTPPKKRRQPPQPQALRGGCSLGAFSLGDFFFQVFILQAFLFMLGVAWW